MPKKSSGKQSPLIDKPIWGVIGDLAIAKHELSKWVSVIKDSPDLQGLAQSEQDANPKPSIEQHSGKGPDDKNNADIPDTEISGVDIEGIILQPMMSARQAKPP